MPNTRVKLGPAVLELGGVEVEARDGHITVQVLLRHLDEVNVAYYRSQDDVVTGLAVQGLFKPAPVNDPNIIGWYREYSVVVSEITANPNNGAWKSLRLELRQYDEEQGRPSIRPPMAEPPRPSSGEIR